ncbi:kelch-like protein 20 [Episyrphus balteatus]|uniref:kelch-like protein 20 n=1 Tax=Episyrphus balteatus TaxID=286459 RepID=UPI002485B981|nr:kelch-like protein 20 [Episyrphus balteatus]
MASTISSSANNSRRLFKCDQHTTTIFENLNHFYKEHGHFDITLSAGEDCFNIPAHRLVLCAFSEYFFEVLSNSQATSLQGNVLPLKLIDAYTLKYIIDFMYSGSIEVILDTVEEILKAALFLKMNTLIDGCCEFIEININCSNSLNWLRFAKEQSLSRLKVKSLECTYNHFEEISKEKDFLMLSENELKDLLFNENPHEDLEEIVFLSMAAWINYDKVNREPLTLELMSLIRFQNLTAEFIVKNRKSVCKSIESYELICSWIEWQLSSNSHLESDSESLSLEPQTTEANNNLTEIQFKSESDSQNLVLDLTAFPQITNSNKVLMVNRNPPDTESIPTPRNLALNPKTPDKIVCLQTNIASKKIVMQIYNSTINVWTMEKEFSLWKNKLAFAAMTVIDAKLIVIGGRRSDKRITNFAEYFDLNSSKWFEMPRMKRNRAICQVAASNECLCVFGHGEEDKGYRVDSMEIYNFSTRLWFVVKSPSQFDSNSKITAWNGIVYILDTFKGYLHSYDISAQKWTFKRLPTINLYLFAFVALEGFLYVIGGNGQTNVERYDVSNNRWSKVAPLPQDCSGKNATVFENKIAVCGNTINGGVIVQVYNPRNDLWEPLSPLSSKDFYSTVICTSNCIE